MLLIQAQNVKGNRPRFEEGRNRLEFVGFAIDQQALRIAPTFDDEQDSVRPRVNSRRSRAACGARILRDRSKAQQQEARNINGASTGTVPVPTLHHRPRSSTLLLQYGLTFSSFHLPAHRIVDSSSLCPAYPSNTTRIEIESKHKGTMANKLSNLLNSHIQQCHFAIDRLIHQPIFLPQ